MQMNKRTTLTALLPKHRDDVESARAILRLGFPSLEPVLPALFQWLETSGSAVELLVRPFFADLGEPAFELVRSALQAPIKPARKSCLLRFVLPGWPRELVVRLEPELSQLVHGYDFYGLDVWALKVLIDKGVGNQEEWNRWRHTKILRLQGQLSALTETRENGTT
jgi:hypothetical protein